MIPEIFKPFIEKLKSATTSQKVMWTLDGDNQYFCYLGRGFEKKITLKYIDQFNDNLPVGIEFLLDMEKKKKHVRFVVRCQKDENFEKMLDLMRAANNNSINGIESDLKELTKYLKTI